MRRMTITLLLILLGGSFAVASAQPELTPIEQLGKLLFFDDNLSTPPGQSCATCHDPATAFAGPISEINAHGAVYPGAVHVRFGNRKPPSAAYMSFSPDFYYDAEEGLYIGGAFWDGRALNITEQAKGPFLNPVEQNNPNKKHVVTKVKHSDYAMLFQEVFGYGSLMDVDQAYECIAQAIAAYEASAEVNPFSSKYDAYLVGLTDLTEQELRGLELYEGRANCAACHPSQPGPNGEPPLFTDFTYDNLGVFKNPENPWYSMPPHFNRDGEDWIDYGLGGVLGLTEQDVADVVAFLNTLTDGWTDEFYGRTPRPAMGLARAAGLEMSAGPNPFRGRMEIRLQVPEATPIHLSIHDPAGRLVRSLLSGRVLGEGEQVVAWNGLDDSGRPAPAGVYFCRAETGAARQTEKVIRLE